MSNNSVFGDKISNNDFLDSVCFCHIVVLTETWQQASDFIIPGFRSFSQPAIKLNNSAKGGRGSGGLTVFIREEYANYILPLKSDNNTLWFKISKDLMNLAVDIYACAVYIPPVNSKYFNSDVFEVLESDISLFLQNGEILLCGDFNARTGNYTDSVETEGNRFISEELNWSPTNETLQKSFDNVINNHGKILLNICKSQN